MPWEYRFIDLPTSFTAVNKPALFSDGAYHARRMGSPVRNAWRTVARMSGAPGPPPPRGRHAAAIKRWRRAITAGPRKSAVVGAKVSSCRHSSAVPTGQRMANQVVGISQSVWAVDRHLSLSTSARRGIPFAEPERRGCSIKGVSMSQVFHKNHRPPVNVGPVRRVQCVERLGRTGAIEPVGTVMPWPQRPRRCHEPIRVVRHRRRLPPSHDGVNSTAPCLLPDVLHGASAPNRGVLDVGFGELLLAEFGQPRPSRSFTGRTPGFVEVELPQR